MQTCIGHRHRGSAGEFNPPVRWFKELFDAVSDGMIILDAVTVFVLDANRRALEFFGCGLEELRHAGLSRFSSNEPPYTRREAFSRLRRVLSGEGEQIFEWHAKDCSGRLFWLEAGLKRVRFSGREYLLLVLREITERFEREAALRKSEDRFRALVESSPVAVGMSRGGRTVYVNDRYLRMFGFARREELYGRPILDQIAPDSREAVLSWLAVRPRDDAGPDEFETVGLRRDGTVFPFYIAVTRIELEDGPAEVGFFFDITRRRRAEEALRDSFDRLGRALNGAISAISAIIAIKDPYTAGHQKRTAQLACAIARKLGMSGERIESIRISASLHDVGKIYVPSEILSKPGTLSRVEREIVKAHARASYDILGMIEFPWPVAEIGLQHQERFDGRGYPRGIAGEDILPEARILAVADGMEAMLSHRPYRRARSVDRAVDELCSGRGTLYDPQVVDACVSLFREEGFSFSSAQEECPVPVTEPG